MSRYNSGEYPEVLLRYIECLQLAEKEFGKSSKAYAYTLKIASGAYYGTGEYEKGILTGREERDILVRLIDTTTIDFGNSIHILGLNYSGAAKFTEALPLLLQTSAIYTDHFGTDSEEFAGILSELGEAYNGLGDESLSLEYFEKSLAVYENLESLPGNYLYTLLNTANLYLEISRFTNSIDKAAQLRSLLAENGMETEEIYGNVLLVAAEASKGSGDFPGSGIYYSEYLRYMEKSGHRGSAEYGYAVNELAAVYKTENKLDSYDSLLKANRDIMASAENSAGLAGYLNLAIIHQNKREFNDAEAAYVDAFKLLQDNAGHEPRLKGLLYENYALLKYSLREYDRALENINQALIIFREQPEELREQASALNTRGLVLKAAGDYKSGRESLDEALAICSATGIKGTVLHAKILENISGYEMESGDITGAIGHIRECLEIHNALSGGKSVEFANALNSYGAILEVSGNYSSAADTLRLALRILGSGETTDPVLRRQVISNLGLISLSSGNASQADSLFQVALEEANRIYGSESFESGKSMVNLARAREALGHYKEAESGFRMGLRTMSARSGKHDPEYLGSSNSFGKFYQVMGNYTEAERIYRENLAGLKNNNPMYGETIQNLATLYQQQGNYDLAEPLLIETLRLDSLLKGTEDPEYGISLQNLASLYQKTGRGALAEPLFSKALKIDETVYGKSHPSYARKLYNLAILHQDEGKYDEAFSLMQESAGIRKEIFGTDHPDYAYGEFGLAMISDILGKDDEARAGYKEALRIYLKQLKDVFPALSEKEKTAFYNKLQPIIEAYRDFAIEYSVKDGSILSDLYDLQLETKAILLNSSSKTRERILNSGDRELVYLFNEWISLKEQIARMYRYSKDELAVQGIDIPSLERRSNDIEKELSEKSEFFKRTSENKDIAWQDVRSSLGPGAGAIEIIRIRKNLRNDSIIYAGLIISQNTPDHPRLVLFPDGNLMENKGYRRYINSITYRVGDKESFSVYWEPLERALGDVATVYLSSDGIYNKINPNTIYDPATQKFVLEKYKIILVSNTRDIPESSRTSEVLRQEAELIGYPDYSWGISDSEPAGGVVLRDSRLRGFFNNGIPSLPGTRREVEVIDSLLKSKNWKTELYTGDRANEDIVKRMQNPRILHLATHGFFLQNKETIFNLNEEESLPGEALIDNPLLNSGILLAGAEAGIGKVPGTGGGTNNDGVLTAFEAMNLYLDRTSLVVLSACETGLGEIKNGEGIYGLQRAFIVAGTSNLAMSLWKVDDRVTGELMSSFYSAWLAGDSLFDAFRDSQMKIMAGHPEPYYWGAFILIGD